MFIWISGALNILGGILALIFQNNPDVEINLGGRPGTIAYGILAILLGIIVIAVSGGILNGSRGARTIVTIVQIVSILGSILAIFMLPGPAVAVDPQHRDRLDPAGAAVLAEG